MQKGIIAFVLSLVVSLCNAQQIKTEAEDGRTWDELSYEEQLSVCYEDLNQAKIMVKGALHYLNKQSFDKAWQYLDTGFEILLFTHDCNVHPDRQDEQLAIEARTLFNQINIVDKRIACTFHIKQATDLFTRGELAFRYFQDTNASIFYFKRSLFAYEDASRFCLKEGSEQIKTASSLVRSTIDDLIAYRKQQNGN